MTLPKFQTAIEIINEVIVPQVDANTKDIQAITKEVISNAKDFKKDVAEIYNVIEKKEETSESKLADNKAGYIKYCNDLKGEIEGLKKQIGDKTGEQNLTKIIDELSVKVEALENEENFEYDDEELKSEITKLNLDFGVFKEKILTSKSVIDEINSKEGAIEASSIKGLVQTLNNIANLGGNSNVKVSGSILEILSNGISVMQGATRLNFTNATVACNNGTVDVTTSGGGGSLTLKTNGTNNGSQTILNLKAGSNISLADDGVGGITITGTGSGGSGITRSVNPIATNTTGATAASTDYVYIATTGLIFTLPTAVGNTSLYTLKANSTGVSFATTSSQTVDGSLTGTLITNQSLSFISNGTNWNLI